MGSNCYRTITLTTPAQVSCISFIDSQQLLVGSDDGTVRLYSLDTSKVLKAARGLDPITSLAFQPQTAAHVWVAAGRQALRFSFGPGKVILTSSDVLQTLDIGVDDDDNVGELSMDAKGTKMAFCTDSGSVGIVDLRTNEIRRTRRSHNSICGSVRFIPGCPGEVVSGGYDCALLHFDVIQGSILSREDLTAVSLSDFGVSLSPPFILSLSISPTGIIAAGTADGRLYIGTSGEKSLEAPGGRRQRKWKGLKMDGRVVINITEGPIVGLSFTGPRELLACTLHGKVTKHQICGSAARGTLKLETRWIGESNNVYKVNSIAFSEGAIVIGGFQKSGRGAIEAWSVC